MYPLVGRLEKNVFYAMGYSGHGVNVSHLAGEVVAEAIGGTLKKMDIFDRVKYYRIPFLAGNLGAVLWHWACCTIAC